jgi:MFS family permease
MICMAAVGVATGMTWPLLSLRLDQMGCDSGSIGLSACVQSAAALAVSPIVPELLTRCGTLRVVGACLVVIITCLLSFPALPGFDHWLGIRAVFGAAVSMVSIATPIWITAVARRDNTGATIGFFGLLWSAGFAMGPCIIWMMGSDGWRPFAAAAGIVTIAALPSWTLRCDVPVVIPATATHWNSVLRGLTTPALTAALMLGILDAANDCFLPLYGLRNGLDESSAVSMLVTLQIGVTAAQLPIGWLADRLSCERLMSVLAGGGMLALCFLPSTAQYSRWRVADIGLLGFSIGGIWTTSVVLLAEQFNGCERAIGNMARAFLYGLGGILFLPLVGFGFDQLGADVLPASGAAAFLLLGLSCSRTRISRRKARI